MLKGLAVFAAVVFHVHSAQACPVEMPTDSNKIAVDDFSLGRCWLSETLQQAEKNLNFDIDRLQILLEELVRYIPSSAQRLTLVRQLTTAVTPHSSVEFKAAILEAIGNLHLLTTDARRVISAAIASTDDDTRKAGLLAASVLAPRDAFFQRQILNAIEHDTDDIRFSLLSQIDVRSPEALAAVTSVSHSQSSGALRDVAKNLLDRWTAHPAPSVEMSQLMATLGDSISVGFFADTNLSDVTRYKVNPNDLNVFWLLGHSSTEEQLKRSWSSGERVRSHFVRLKNQLKTLGRSDDLEVFNVARAGAKTNELLKQISRLDAKLAVNPKMRLIYVTLLMGSNDVCDEVEPSEITRNISRALDRLNRLPSNGKIVVLIAGLPPIHQLGLAKIANHTALAGLTCEAVQQQRLRFCDKFTKSSSGEFFASNKEAVDLTNEKIAQVVAQAKNLANLRLVFAPGFSKADVAPESMAFDCFHPNELGQEAIADTLWQDLVAAGVSW